MRSCRLSSQLENNKNKNVTTTPMKLEQEYDPRGSIVQITQRQDPNAPIYPTDTQQRSTIHGKPGRAHGIIAIPKPRSRTRHYTSTQLITIVGYRVDGRSKRLVYTFGRAIVKVTSCDWPLHHQYATSKSARRKAIKPPNRPLQLDKDIQAAQILTTERPTASRTLDDPAAFVGYYLPKPIQFACTEALLLHDLRVANHAG